MCGIVGFWGNFDSCSLSVAMEMLAHRGPDQTGTYVARSLPAMLGHTRLSIIDLEHGRQPMSDSSRRLWVAFNGEIYNFMALREELENEGYHLTTRSDTEVILYAYRKYGKDFVTKLNGMFAIALLDEGAQELILVRDRLGIKPLYYALEHRGLVFASEIKAILGISGGTVAPEVSEICALLTWGYSISDQTIFRGIHRVLPGEMLTYNGACLARRRYWRLPESPDWHLSNDRVLNEELAARLKDAVSSHLVSDVPVGVALSGGVDSSIVAALASASLQGRLKAYSIGYGLPDDEITHAETVASALGVPLIARRSQLESMVNALGRMIWHLEEPIPHVQMATTYSAASLIHDSRTKVVLIGEGADELFAGYPRHLLVQSSLLKVFRDVWLNRSLSNVTAYRALPGDVGGRYLWGHYGLVPTRLIQVLEGEWTQEIDEFIQLTRDHLAYYFSSERRCNLYQALRCDIEYQLPNSQLLRVDKLMMARAVEARVPFLDHRLVEWCMRLPVRHKLSLFQNKVLLRRAAERWLPRTTIWRPKTGLGGTQGLLGPWMDRGLRDVILGLITRESVSRRGFFRWSTLQQVLGEFHKSGQHAKLLFAIALIEIWCRIFVDGSDPDSVVIPGGSVQHLSALL